MARLLLALALLLSAACCAGCGAQRSAADPGQVDATTVPEVGACRNLTAADIEAPTNATALTDCADPHDAQTYAAGTLPARFADASYDDPALADWAYSTCTSQLERHLGADESLVMRSILTWVWFRPSTSAWDAGARWYRCDLIGGQAPDYIDLPTSTANLLRGHAIDDQWLACARGESVDGGTRVPCSQPHDWRAVSTIKVGEPGDRYPGDDVIRSKTDDYCKDSVSASLGYPTDYDYGYTWFGEQEWAAGNRRSVCWARTSS